MDVIALSKRSLIRANPKRELDYVYMLPENPKSIRPLVNNNLNLSLTDEADALKLKKLRFCLNGSSPIVFVCSVRLCRLIPSFL